LSKSTYYGPSLQTKTSLKDLDQSPNDEQRRNLEVTTKLDAPYTVLSFILSRLQLPRDGAEPMDKDSHKAAKRHGADAKKSGALNLPRAGFRVIFSKGEGNKQEQITPSTKSPTTNESVTTVIRKHLSGIKTRKASEYASMEKQNMDAPTRQDENTQNKSADRFMDQIGKTSYKVPSTSQGDARVRICKIGCSNVPHNEVFQTYLRKEGARTQASGSAIAQKEKEANAMEEYDSVNH